MTWLNITETFPVNADDTNLIEQFEELNNITINIYTLDKEAYSSVCLKKLHHLWTAKYMTKKPAMEINTSSHLDLMLIRKVISYEQNDKVDAKVSIYQTHYILFLDAIELATNARKNNSQTLQCIKCKQHLVGRTRKAQRLCFNIIMRMMNVLKDQLDIQFLMTDR